MQTIITINEELDKIQLLFIKKVIEKIVPNVEIKHHFEINEDDDDEFYEYIEALGGYPDYF